MTNLFAFRSKLFWPALAVALLPFVILAFLNSMALDDYFFYDLYREKGFWSTQHDLYLTWAGRYTSSLITGAFIVLDLPGRFPWTLLYFLSTWIAIGVLLRSVRPMLPAGFSGFSGRGWWWRAAAVLFVLLLYVQADIATGFFWLSSATVYQTAFILFLLLIATIIRKLGSPESASHETPSMRASRSLSPGDFLFFLLIVLLVGCNEIMAVFLPLFLAAMAGFFYVYGRSVGRWLWFGLAIAIGMDLIIFFTSGVISHRQQLMNTGTGFFTIVPIIGFRMIEVVFYIFKEPLFWGCAVACFVSGIAVSPQLKQPGPLAFFRDRNIFLPGVMGLFSVVLLSLAAFLLASRGSIPPRALNNLGDVTAICLLAIAFLTGIHRGARLPVQVLPKLSPAIQTTILVSMLLASVNYAQAWKSVVSGYFYHSVLADRDHILRRAAAEHRHVAIVPSYDSALKEKIDRVFPHGVFATARDLMIQKPGMLVFYDGAAVGDAAYAHFYGLDSIIVGPNVRDK